MKRFYLITVLMAFALFANAQNPQPPKGVGTHWTYNTHTEFVLNLTGEMFVDDVSMKSNASSQYLEIGAFCGNECRGSFLPDYVNLPFNTGYVYQMQIYSNVESGEEITFRVWNHQTGQEWQLSCNTTLTFEANGIMGTLMNPFNISFSTQILEITIDDEICYGENYIDNGFEIIMPPVGETTTSMTLQSYAGYDSIVNLHLTVNPTYFYLKELTVCESSYEWHGKTLTESGIYYDTLQTVHGCDSVFQLNLEFFNTPLGEFTYMSPTNNYPFTSLPITFTWDAVPGAQYYDLYVWENNAQMPEEPFAGNLTSGHYSTTGLLNYHTYNWCVKAKNYCNDIVSNIKSFYLDITPSLNVNVENINFGELILNQSSTTTLSVTGVVLEDIITVDIVGDDATMFSFTKASGWNDFTGGIIILTFNPTVMQYSYNANLVVTSGTLEQTVSLSGGLADMFVFNTYVNQDVYAMNNPIPIYGSVTDVSNEPVPDAEVEISVFAMGSKRTLQAITDAAGQFEALFEPYSSESGYYTINSGRPGNNSTAIHDDFNIPGMMLVSSNYNLCEVTQDQPHTDSILIRNKSNLPLSSITVTTITSPDGSSFSFMPLNLGGLEEGYLVYTANGTILTEGNYYQEAKLKATSGEGAEMNFSIWYYCMEARGILDVAPKSIATTMTKGHSKIVDVMLTNNGTAETGDIYIDLPDVEWMSVVGNDTLSSIAVNDTAYFSLRFSPGNDIQLTQYYGTIAINSERGDAVALPYTITAVSDTTGAIVIDVTDDFTWNTNRGLGPHLANAEVTLTGYFSLETVAHGYTDSDGLFQVDNLPEGYYRLHVSAFKHSEYDQVIQIVAGETNNRDIYLQYQPITYSWNVVPTEIEDMYTYELVVEYETNVPVPVITIEHTGIHALEDGESANFNLIITNHGLIDAYDTHIYFTESEDYIFVPLFDNIDTLSALTTVIVPGTYYRNNNRNNNRAWVGNCNVTTYTISIYYCNAAGGWSPLINYAELFTLETCFAESGGGGGGGGFPGFVTSFGGPFSSDGNKKKHEEFEQGEEFCTPCLDAVLSSIESCIPGGGIAKCIAFHNLKDLLHSRDNNAISTLISCALDELKDEIVDAIIPIGHVAKCLAKTCGNLSECIKVDIYERGDIRGNMDNVQNTIDGLYYSSLYYANEINFLKSVFAEDTWEEEENIVEFFEEFQELMDMDSGFVTNSDAIALATNFVGTAVTYDDIISFITRWNRSIEYWANDYYVISDLPLGYDTCFIQVDTMMVNQMIRVEEYFENNGYVDIDELYEESIGNANDIINNASQSSVCAHVTVKFSQNMTMTREAFEGTLTIHNGHESEPIEAIGVSFLIKDENGNDCTSLFQINTLSLNNITGIDGSGALGANDNGVAKIQFIPTKQAAPTEPKIYYFGGSLSFIDPYSSDEIVYNFFPVAITVNPSPDLYIDYFMQRDILGDDALTLDKVEPSIPAELGVIINNKGAGVAKNVTLETAEPEIIENEKGLAIDFAMYGASFNGSPRQLGLKAIPFGNIESGHTAVGEWLFTSTLLGHFISYEANVIHNNSYDNPDLSLVSSLKIHELIHPIYAYGNLDDGINDFLVNDVMDAYDQPDSIYFSHGGKTAVGIVNNISYDHVVTLEDSIVTLTINPSKVGWNYGVIDDPGTDKFELVSCTRDYDGQIIPLNNVWQTFVRIPDGGDPVYENSLHIIDTLGSDSQNFTYTLVYSLKTNLLDVEEITGIPENFIDYPLESFTVKFNEAIIDSTFTYEDMTLKCNNGPNLMNESVVITKIEDMLYEVNITGLTNQTGYYVLNVNTLNISDTRGYGGYNGKQATWVQYITSYTQTNTLTSGWNWWSTYIDMSTEQDFDKLKTALGANASMIKSRTSGFVSYYDGWYGTLNLLTNSEMYMINMNSAQDISISGPLASLAGNPITLNQGWNWIGYPTNIGQDINTALVNLSALGNDMLKSRNAFATYYPSLGWIGTLTSLTPGTGYMYNSSNAETVSFVYASPTKDDYQPQEMFATNHWDVSVGEYETNATIIGVIDIDGEEQRDENLIVGAFIGNNCVGQTNAMYVEALDRYFVFLTYFGNDNDEITFRLFDEANNVEYNESETSVVFLANSMLGTVDNPFVIDFNTLSVGENDFAMLSLFPNPVKAGNNVRIRVCDDLSAGLEINIITSLGSEYDKTISRGSIVEMKAPDTPGVYTVKITDKKGNVRIGKLFVE